MSQKTWIVDLIESPDDSGDAILSFPDDLIAETGWKEGDTLNMKVEETPTGNVLIITGVK